MYKFLLFLKTIHTVLLFIVLEFVAGWIFFGGTPYHKARFINSSNIVMGEIYDKSSSVVNFFSLAGENRKLAEENARLRHELSRLAPVDSIPAIDTTLASKYIAARVVRNSISKANNFITINKGRAQGIEPEMALLNEQGIVGYVLDCSENFSVAISILNHNDFSTGGQIKGSDFTGSVTWDGMSHRIVQLNQIPKYAQMSVGDTIVTIGYSNIFPAECPIGVVREFQLIDGTFLKADVELFADMSQLKYVYAVQIPFQAERAALERDIK